MKMPENIIKKFNLIETEEQFGQSFKNGLRVYKSTRTNIQHLRFAECDIRGNDAKYISIINTQARKSIQVTPPFLDILPFEAMINEAL